MSWSQIVGHASIVDRFRNMLVRGRLASSFLFCGPAGIGKFTFARQLGQALLCEAPAQPLEPCGRCLGCVQVAAGTHPDLIVVQRPADKNFIPVEKFIGPDERRMQEGLCFELGLKPFRGGRKIAIIDDADFLNQEGANCLLKTLEEPPPKSVLILIATSPQKQLPTIRSRCQWIPFSPLSAAEIESVVLTKGLAEEPAQARRMAELSGGSVQQAVLMKDLELVSFRAAWLNQLASLDPAQQQFAKAIAAIVDAAGSDAAVKRDRLRLVCDIAVDFFRQTLWELAGVAGSDETALRSAVTQASRHFVGNESGLARCLSRCEDGYGEIAANANTTLWIECLLSDLGRLARGEFVAVEYV
jgi:DNA polymerase-3 subunit delta'